MKYLLFLFRSLFIRDRSFVLIAGQTILFVLGFIHPFWMTIAWFYLGGLLILVIIEVWQLFGPNTGVLARRDTMDRLSNGDPNGIDIFLESFYSFPVIAEVIDEVPYQFQARNMRTELTLRNRAPRIVQYELTPKERGVYKFGAVNVLARTRIGLVARKYQFSQNMEVPVFPSFIQMRKYELMAVADRLTHVGVKKTRKVGQSMEFERIREYVQGDDQRTINWKATARRNKLMVNQYQEEKAQQVISVIDTGRVMELPFNKMTLLDYAINSSLIMSDIALLKGDKAGLMTYSNKLHQFLEPSPDRMQLKRIMQGLYNVDTGFLESDVERLYISVRRRIPRRSLLMLYTNFETLTSMRRQLPYLKRIANTHLLLVIFFENTELSSFIQEDPVNTIDIHEKTLAEKYVNEKAVMVKEFEKNGIPAIMSPPEQLNAMTINKYLELKARSRI